MLSHLEDIFASFNRNDVRYLVIGGIAVVLHGVPRATFDLDVLIEASHKNAESLLAALKECGFETAELTSADELLGSEITVFDDRIRIDVQTSTPGITFEDAWTRREERTHKGKPYHLASREDIIASKRAAGRPVDLEDVRQLEHSTSDDGNGIAG